MATQAEIAQVRLNTDEPTEDSYTDEAIDGLIASSGGVTQASAEIWRQKAARFAALVSTSVEGASYSFGELARNARDMASMYAGLVPGTTRKGIRSRALTR
jgi:hypothetical protein